jgi:putative copper export protein
LKAGPMVMGEMAAAGGMAGPMIGRALCDAPILAALLLAFGLALFMLAVAPAEPALDSPRPTFWILLRVLATVQLVLWPLKLLINVASMAGVGVGQALPFVSEVLRETHFGHDWAVSALLAVALAMAAWMPGPHSNRAGMAALASAFLLICWADASHAVDFGSLAVIVYFLHEAVAGLWAGSLVGLWVVGRGLNLADGVLRLTAQRVSRVSGWCVAVLVLSGVGTAYRTLGLNLGHLVNSPYGQILIAKILLMLLVIGLGGYNRYRLVPAVATASARTALLVNVAVECFLLTGVLGLAALLANTSPPH